MREPSDGESGYTRPPRISLSLLRSFLIARSIGRGLPPPVAVAMGLRVDTGFAAEPCRYVFPAPTPAVSHLAARADAGAAIVRMFGTPGELQSLLPSDWHVARVGALMRGPSTLTTSVAPPDGYRTTIEAHGRTTRIGILAPDGSLAGSGLATRIDDILMYDRIEVAAAHRRRGIGRAIMAALAARGDGAARHILTASPDGQKLYAALGWTVRSDYCGAARSA